MQFDPFLRAHYLQQQGLARIIEWNTGLTRVERIIRGTLEPENLSNPARVLAP